LFVRGRPPSRELEAAPVFPLAAGVASAVTQNRKTNARGVNPETQTAFLDFDL
jgi:hypothetical protein